MLKIPLPIMHIFIPKMRLCRVNGVVISPYGQDIQYASLVEPDKIGLNTVFRQEEAYCAISEQNLQG